jgi:nicotinamidase/pyrazinamidase
MKVLFIIDMIKDFINPDGALYCGDTSREIIPFVQRKIAEFRRNNDLVVFICDSHEEDDPEFKIFPKHSVAGTKGAEIIDELPVKKKDIIVKKKRFSAFYGTSLDIILKENNVSEVAVVGVCTSICVMDTVGDLRNRDYKVIVYKKGVADFDQNAHRFALERMSNIYGAKVM